MDDQTSKTRLIAEQNDRFRQMGPGAQLRGMMVMTPGISALPFPYSQTVLIEVQAFTAFDGDNDPHGEHDFGGFEVDGAGKVFWKIDYYADDQLEYGSEDPSDPAQTYRVLTVMLAPEY